MGENENWHEPGELLPNGLLPGAGPGPAMQALDRERWWRAEGRTAELLACIKPNPLAEVRRNAVADYVRLLIMKCFPCQVFTFGSVPLKTYLPDGDIDLTVFAPDQNMKDRWANLVCEKLESEEKNENAKFRVKEVQFIQAEVKIIKCLVENIVVDISFNQVGGLCTLCFLEEVDNLISQSYVFKQSIILVKAWCYYESRILGAHHGLISTYALETLVLYIFHVFNNSFQGPLEVLFRFLEFFSKFDWDNFCVSLWGPVPITTLPDIAADPPRKDSGELLLSKSFLDGCSLAYAVFPGGLENNAQPFISKHFNVIDPLRVNNNLGRSVSKGNFFRIRSAFAFGAKRLARLLDCPDENLITEVNQFFTNTWERHGSGRRPDTAGGDILHERLSTLDARHDFGKSDDIVENNVNQKSVVLEKEDRGICGHGVSSQHGGISAKMMPITSELSAAPHVENLKSQNLKTLWVTDQMGSRNISGPVLHSHGIQTDSKAVHLVNDTQGRFFARTNSSPELTDAYGDVSSQSWRSRQTEASYANGSYSKMNTSNRKQNHGSDSLGRLVNHSSVEDASSRSLDAAAYDSRCVLNSHHKDLGSDDFSAEFSSNSQALGTTLQENQDIVNKMASASLQSFDGPFHIPFNLNPTHIPFSIQPSFLASMGYTHQNMSGFGPTNIPLINEPCPNVKSPYGLVSEQLTPCFHGFGVDLPSETPFERSSENFDPVEKNSKDQDACSSRGCDPENGNFSDGLHSDSRPPPALMPGSKYAPPSRAITSDNSMRVHPKHTRGKHVSVQQSIENFPIPEERSTSSRFSSSMHLSSLSSKASDFSWDGSPTKSSTEKWARKMASVDQASTHGKGKIMSEPVLNNWIDDNEKKCVIMPKMGTEMMIERQPEPESAVSFQVPGHHMPGLEAVQTNVMDSMIPLNPMLIDPGLRQTINDNSGLVPFYPAGPPIPFLTMLYNVPSEKGNSDLSRGDCEGDATLKNSESIHGPLQYNYSENLNTSNSWRESSAAKISERKIPDILHGDFASHWQNLQFARFCQDPQCHGPLLHPSPVMVPPAYLQGQFPYENPGRLLLTNANIFSQLMTSYGHHLAPVAPIQSVSGRPPNMYQHYTEEMGRSRTGTGTYLPNPGKRDLDKC